MAILIGQHEFEGPIKSLADIPASPGLYALLHEDHDGFMIVDIQESENLIRALSASSVCLKSQATVVLPCTNRTKRQAVLAEIVRELEFEEDDLVLDAPKRRSNCA